MFVGIGISQILLNLTSHVSLLNRTQIRIWLVLIAIKRKDFAGNLPFKDNFFFFICTYYLKG